MPDSPVGSLMSEALAESYLRATAGASPPTVETFLAATPDARPAEVAAVLRVELRRQWRRGERTPVGTLLARFPQVANDRTAAIDLIYTEYLLREESGQQPLAAEYARSYPEYADDLSTQIEIHLTLQTDEADEDTEVDEYDERDAEQDESETRCEDRPAGLRTIGRYEVVRLLGSGGMGVVYLARDQLLDRLVALKLPRLADNFSPEQIDRFYREARVVARLSDQHLCAIYDVGHQDGLPYLAMQYVEGETLEARMRREGPLDVELAVELADQIAAALEVVHRSGVLHRDLKPANVMLNIAGEVVVMDFGVAHLTQSMPTPDSGLATVSQSLQDTTFGAARDTRLTETGQLLGTPAYAAPEQLAGAASLTPACDVYSLGVVLYEMLTGHAPFAGTLAAVARRIDDEQMPRPSQQSIKVPLALDEVCLRAMAEAPTERFASMTEFRSALNAVRTSLAIDRPRVLGVLHRVRWSWLGGAAALVAVLCQAFLSGTLPIVREKAESTSPQKSSPSRLRNLLGNDVFELATSRHTGTVERLAFSPNGRLIATASNDRTVQIWEASTGNSLEILRGHSETVFDVAFNAQEEWIATAGRDETIKIWSTGTFQEHCTLSGHEGPVYCLAFAADGRLFSGGEDGKLRVWNFHESRTSTVFGDQGTVVVCLALSPDGLQLATGSYEGTVRIWDTATGRQTGTLKHGAQTQSIQFSPDGKYVASCGHDHLLKLWDRGGKLVQSFRGHTDYVTAMSFSPDSLRMATGSWDGTLRLWSVPDGHELARWDGNCGMIECVAYNPDGKTIAAGGTNWMARVFSSNAWSDDERLARRTLAAAAPHGEAVDVITRRIQKDLAEHPTALEHALRYLQSLSRSGAAGRGD